MGSRCRWHFVLGTSGNMGWVLRWDLDRTYTFQLIYLEVMIKAKVIYIILGGKKRRLTKKCPVSSLMNIQT